MRPIRDIWHSSETAEMRADAGFCAWAQGTLSLDPVRVTGLGVNSDLLDRVKIFAISYVHLSRKMLI